MEPRSIRRSAILALCAILTWAAVPAGATEGAKKTYRIILFTGGGYHDYKYQSQALKSRIEAAGPFHVDVVFGLEPFAKRDYGGYDLLMLDHCFSKDKISPAARSYLLDLIRSGKPVVGLHCFAHCWLWWPEYHDMVGMKSHMHDPYGRFTVKNVDPASPITAGWPKEGFTTRDELYNTDALTGTVHPLLQAVSPYTKRTHTVAWTQHYGKGRVFGTTLGHDRATFDNPLYIHLVLNGIRWALGLPELSTPRAETRTGR